MVGIRIFPAISPPRALPARQGSSSSRGGQEELPHRRDTRHTGSMMAMEVGKTSSSGSRHRTISNGTRIMPPPAPRRPLTAPAQNPAKIRRNTWERSIKTPLRKFLPGEVFLYTEAAAHQGAPPVVYPLYSMFRREVFFRLLGIASTISVYHSSMSSARRVFSIM